MTMERWKCGEGGGGMGKKEVNRLATKVGTFKKPALRVSDVDDCPGSHPSLASPCPQSPAAAQEEFEMGW